MELAHVFQAQVIAQQSVIKMLLLLECTWMTRLFILPRNQRNFWELSFGKLSLH